MYVYGIAVLLYILSSVITITNVFIVFVDGAFHSVLSHVGKVVYSKSAKQSLSSAKVLLLVVSHG